MHQHHQEAFSLVPAEALLQMPRTAQKASPTGPPRSPCKGHPRRPTASPPRFRGLRCRHRTGWDHPPSGDGLRLAVRRPRRFDRPPRCRQVPENTCFRAAELVGVFVGNWRGALSTPNEPLVAGFRSAVGHRRGESQRRSARAGENAATAPIASSASDPVAADPRWLGPRNSVATGRPRPRRVHAGTAPLPLTTATNAARSWALVALKKSICVDDKSTGGLFL
jgi:hypothetical protein